VNRAPLKFVDPSGHKEQGACDDPYVRCIDDEIYAAYWAYCSEHRYDPACQSTLSQSVQNLMVDIYKALVDSSLTMRLAQVVCSGGYGYLEDEGISSAPSDANKNIWGGVLIQSYKDLIVAAANASANPLITPDLLAAIVRTQGGPNYPLLGLGEQAQIQLQACRGCCSVGIAQVDACTALRLQDLDLVPERSTEMEVALLLATDPAMNLAYMVAMLEYCDQRLVDYYRQNGLGVPPDEFRLQLMEVIQNSQVAWFENLLKNSHDPDGFEEMLRRELERNPSAGKVLPWIEWSGGEMHQ